MNGKTTVETTVKKIEDLIKTNHFNSAIEEAVKFQSLIPEIEALLVEMKKAEPTIDAYKKTAREALRQKNKPTAKKAAPKIQIPNMPKAGSKNGVAKKPYVKPANATQKPAAAVPTNVVQKPTTTAPTVKANGVIGYIDKLLAPLKR